MNVNLDDIYTLLSSRISDTDELLLEGGLFDEMSEALAAVGKPNLLLKEARVEFTDRRLIVRGKTDLLKLTGLSTRLEVTGETQHRLYLKFDLPSDWNFNKSFAALPRSYKTVEGNAGLVTFKPSILDDFSFSDAAFVVQNFDDGPLSTGLNFSGVISDPAPLGYLKKLLNIADGTPLQGPVSIKGDAPPDLQLEFVIANPDLDLGSALKVNQVACQIRTVPPTEDEDEPETRLELVGKFRLGKTRPIHISARTPIFSGSPVFSFQAEFGGGGLTVSDGINALAEFASGTNVDFELPRELMVDAFQLKEFALCADMQPPSVRHMQFTAASNKRWTMFSDIAVTNLQFDWLILFPFNQAARDIATSVSGTLELGSGDTKVHFDVTASRRSNFTAAGSLREGDVIHLAKLIEVALGLRPGGLPQLDIEMLEIEASTTGDFLVRGSLNSDWTFSVRNQTVALKEIAFSFSRTGNKKKGKLSSVLEIAGARLYLNAGVPDSGDGFVFAGGTIDDKQQLDLTAVGDYLLKTFGVNLPASLPQVLVKKLTTEFNTATKAFSFVAKGNFQVDDKRVAITLYINLQKKADNTYDGNFSGEIVVGSSTFTLIFSKDSSAKVFVATYSNKEGIALSLRSFINNLSTDVAGVVPEELRVELKNALFAFRKNDQGNKFLLGVQFGTRLSLSDLPLVGKDLPADKAVSVDSLRVLVTSASLNVQEVDEINKVIPSDIGQLPAARPDATSDSSGRSPATDEILAKGLTISARMNFGETSKELIMQPGKRARRSTVEPLPAAPEALTASSPDDVKWFTLQKSFGPVFFDKVGVQYHASKLRFLMNAALSAAGLTLTLEGLSLGSSLSKFTPEFELSGLGIDYKNDAVEIGGAFVGAINNGKPDYNGSAVIKTKQFAVTALGSYTELYNQPSLFIYAFLDYPLGGPAFFFVTGLAAGFGYNRRLIAPSIDDVAKFPLITQAMGKKQDAPKDVMAALTSLHSHVPPDVGSIFLAVGVKFNSFKLVDSFALLTIEFGNNFSINLLGVSKAVVPTPEAGKTVTPLAQVEIAWKATFNPDDGCLAIDARLTPNSFILSKDCRLTGGFAFYSWFSGRHAGDFVQTLGGYHPEFQVPDHYPKVPRLAFDWRISSSLTIQGQAYYALTGSALMAGGHLEVLFREGELRAWLKLGANFLIAWKPYHYDALMYVNVGASYTFDINLLFGHVRVTISVDVGAQLHLWGPEFSGTARIDLSVISFTISFGAGASQKPPPLKDWSTFQQSFLPPKDVCSISVKQGLVRQLEAKGTQRLQHSGRLGAAAVWVINPKEFSLVVDSAVPFKSAKAAGAELTTNENKSFGVGPMAVNKDRLYSTINVSLEKDGRTVDGNFKYLVIKKRMPAGLWGESTTPEVNDKRFLEDVPAGIEIIPGKGLEPGQSAKISLKLFEYSDAYYPKGGNVPEGHAYEWRPASEFKPARNVIDPTKDVTDAERRSEIAKSVASNSRRDALLAEMGTTFMIDIKNTVADDFLSAPQIGKL